MLSLPRAVLLVLWSWLIRASLAYSYELRAHVTFTTDANDYTADLLVGSFAGYGQASTQREKGRLVVADETYGCSQSNATLPPVVTSSSFIVVLPLSGCSDYLQAKKAEQDNAAGVVFYYTSESSRDSTSSGGDRLAIPVAVIEVGKEILGHVNGQTSPQYTAVAIEGMHYAVFQQSRTFYFIVTAFCILILLSCLWFFTSYFRRCRYSLRNRRRQAQAQNSAKKAISKLKVRSYKISKGSQDRENCAVCLELYTNNDVIRVLPCRHEFHRNCVDPWLKLKQTCPLCKNNITDKSSTSSFSAEQQTQSHSHTDSHSQALALSPSTDSIHSSSDSSSVTGSVQQQEMRLLASSEVSVNIEDEEENVAPDTRIA